MPMNAYIKNDSYLLYPQYLFMNLEANDRSIFPFSNAKQAQIAKIFRTWNLFQTNSPIFHQSKIKLQIFFLSNENLTPQKKKKDELKLDCINRTFILR